MAPHRSNAADSLIEEDQLAGAARSNLLEHLYSVNDNLQLNSTSHLSTPSLSVGQAQQFRLLQSDGCQGQEIASNDYNRLLSSRPGDMDYLIEQPLTAGIIDQPQHSNPPPPVVRSSAEDPTSHSHVANARQNKPEEQDSAVPKAYRGLVKTYSDWRTCRPCSTAGRSCKESTTAYRCTECGNKPILCNEPIMMPDGPDASFWSNAATSIITDDLALRNDLQNLIAEDHQICINRHQSSRDHPSFASLRLTSRDEIFIRCKDLQPLGQNIGVEPRIHQYVAKILGLAELPPETALNDQETALSKDVYLVKYHLQKTKVGLEFLCDPRLSRIRCSLDMSRLIPWIVPTIYYHVALQTTDQLQKAFGKIAMFREHHRPSKEKNLRGAAEIARLLGTTHGYFCALQNRMEACENSILTESNLFPELPETIKHLIFVGKGLAFKAFERAWRQDVVEMRNFDLSIALVDTGSDPSIAEFGDFQTLADIVSTPNFRDIRSTSSFGNAEPEISFQGSKYEAIDDTMIKGLVQEEGAMSGAANNYDDYFMMGSVIDDGVSEVSILTPSSTYFSSAAATIVDYGHSQEHICLKDKDGNPSDISRKETFDPSYITFKDSEREGDAPTLEKEQKYPNRPVLKKDTYLRKRKTAAMSFCETDGGTAATNRRPSRIKKKVSKMLKVQPGGYGSVKDNLRTQFGMQIPFD